MNVHIYKDFNKTLHPISFIQTFKMSLRLQKGGKCSVNVEDIPDILESFQIVWESSGNFWKVS